MFLSRRGLEILNESNYRFSGGTRNCKLSDKNQKRVYTYLKVKKGVLVKFNKYPLFRCRAKKNIN